MTEQSPEETPEQVSEVLAATWYGGTLGKSVVTNDPVIRPTGNGEGSSEAR